MRQKKVKNLDIEVMNTLGVITTINKIDIDSKYNKINLEIGSGKGQFITTLAIDNPNELFIALEKNINVCYRIVEKKLEHKIDNLIVILGDSIDLLEMLNKESIDNLFLNFSDPWPKARHHKRRLTYQPFLDLYKQLLKTTGTFQFRTDHLELFNDSLEYFENNFDIYEVDRDFVGEKYSTEYEDKKRIKGVIYQCRGRKL